MKVQSLRNSAKETTKEPQTFIALAGEVNTGNELLTGLEIGIDEISQYRQESIIKPYMQVVPDMGIDSEYISFYHADDTTKEKYYNVTAAMTKYNDIILDKVQDLEKVEQYLIKNIPPQEQELSMGYIKGEGYRDAPESCMILASVESQQREGEFSALIYRNGKFSVMDNVKNNRFGSLDLQSVNRPEFNIEDIQEALDEFATRTKEVSKEHSIEEIENGLEGILEEVKISDVKAVLDEMEHAKDKNIERE